jgi:hypothetical protein
MPRLSQKGLQWIVASTRWEQRLRFRGVLPPSGAEVPSHRQRNAHRRQLPRAYSGGVSLGEGGLPRTLINRAIGHPIDGFCQIGILFGVFVAEQHQIVEGIVPQDIAKAIGGRKLCDPGERSGTAVQFVGSAGIKRSIIRPAKCPARDLGNEGAKRSDVEWHSGFFKCTASHHSQHFN